MIARKIERRIEIRKKKEQKWKLREYLKMRNEGSTFLILLGKVKTELDLMQNCVLMTGSFTFFFPYIELE